MPHEYRITIQSLATELPAAHGGRLTFDVINHDDVLELVDRVAARDILPLDEVAEFTIGLKLFSEIMLRHRSEPLFAELFPHFGTFMKRLKSDAPNGLAGK